jgi:hypothetical protein
MSISEPGTRATRMTAAPPGGGRRSEELATSGFATTRETGGIPATGTATPDLVVERSTGPAGDASDSRERADLEPRLDPEHYSVARYPRGWRPAEIPDGWSAFVRDGDEVTIVASDAAFASGVLGDVTPVAVEAGWRRITFPGPLPWELVGFLADVAQRLATAHVPFTSMSGFTTDHLLVRAAHAELAVSVLRGFPPPPQRPGTNP